MLFLSGFYWEMTISGEDIPYAESEILAAAKRVGVYIGAPRSTDTALASVALLEELPELSWASFNTEGCTVQLELRTSVTKAEGAEHDGTGDIVASRAGLIHSITAQNGTVLVKVGSACAAGRCSFPASHRWATRMTRNITPCAVFTPAPVRRFWRRHSAHSRHPVRLVPKRCAKRTSVHSARCIFGRARAALAFRRAERPDGIHPHAVRFAGAHIAAMGGNGARI